MKYILCFENEQKMNEFVDAHKFTKEEPMVLGSKDGAEVVYSSDNIKKLTKAYYLDGSVGEYDIVGELNSRSIDNPEHIVSLMCGDDVTSIQYGAFS